jgi:hypothetical protein
MSFDLKITFTGMCLFVPDSRDVNTPRMHVLLPETSAHPHSAKLMYDRAYKKPGASSLERFLACHRLDRMELRFRGTGGSATQELPSEIVNLRLTLDKRVTPDKLADPAPASVKSRITLESGAVTDYEYGAAWDLPYHKDVPMTWQVEWTIHGLDPATFAWELVNLDTEQAEDLPKLHPVGGIVHVYVYHVLTDELPGTDPLPALQIPKDNERAEHFAAFFSLATGGINDTPKFKKRPVVQVECPESKDADADAHAHTIHDHAVGSNKALLATHVTAASPARGGSPFTCMTATAPIG